MICLSKLAARTEPFRAELSIPQLGPLLDIIALPIFLLNRDRTIAYANATGHEQLEKGELVHMRCGRFHVKATTVVALKFEAMVRSVTSESGSFGTPRSIVLNGSEGGKFSVTVTPYVDPNEIDNLAAVILTADDPCEAQGALRLQHMLALTSSEARVAYYISAGHRLVQIAERLEVSINTVKTHLASIFSKTGCADQSALAVMTRRMLTPVKTTWTEPT